LAGAEIYSSIEYTKNKLGKWQVYAYMNEKFSWKIARDKDGLLHEQYHFNITELFARKLRQQIVLQKLLIESIAFKQLYFKMLRMLNEMQNKYDTETEHSLNETLQLQWQKYIDEELAKLDEFKSHIID
jgi:hypothetical protein